jgi:ribose transport system permease protein
VAFVEERDRAHQGRFGSLAADLHSITDRAKGRTLSGLAPLAALGIIFGIGSVVVTGWTTKNNIDSMLILASFLGIAPAGQTLVIILGGIDLSVAAGIGLGEVVTTVLYSRGIGFPEIIAILVGCSVIIGAANGLISSVFRIHPLIVSLGVGAMVTGGVLIWTSGGATQGVSPPFLQRIETIGSSIGPIPVPQIVLVWLAVAIVLIVIQRGTTFGRWIYALGNSPEAARLALVPRVRTWTAVYILSAASSILTGMLLSGFSFGANFGVGDPYLFNSIAAVVIGGTSLLGGSGGYERTIIGSLIVIEITTLLVGIGFDPALQESMLGGFIIFAAAVAGREPHIRSRT